jgi:hypothetical protein
MNNRTNWALIALSLVLTAILCTVFYLIIIIF